MARGCTVKVKMILKQCTKKGKRIKHGRRMQQMTKDMIMKKKPVIEDKLATISMPHVLLHPLEKSVFIPDDVIPEILVKLPTRSVGRFRCVCKSWLSITTNLSFIRAHTQCNRFTHQSLIFNGRNISQGRVYYLATVDRNIGIGFTRYKRDEMRCRQILASCDGLMYIRSFDDTYIVNPLTGYSVTLPRSEGFYLGFYFHNSTSKYRVIHFMKAIKVDTAVLVVGEQSWRRLPGRFPCYLTCGYYHSFVDLNGCLFWLAFKEASHCEQPNTILSFDKESEIYNLLSLPPSEKLHDLVGNLVDFKGELGLWVVGNDNIDVWIKEECWVKRYSINYVDLNGCSVSFGPQKGHWIEGVAVFVSDEELLIDQHVYARQSNQYLIRCNLKSGACLYQVREINGRDVGRSLRYMETLVYPDS